MNFNIPNLSNDALSMQSFITMLSIQVFENKSEERRRYGWIMRRIIYVKVASTEMTSNRGVR